MQNVFYKYIKFKEEVAMKNKFKIICLECKSEDVVLEEEIDYDYEENPYVSGYYLECKNCGNYQLY